MLVLTAFNKNCSFLLLVFLICVSGVLVNSEELQTVIDEEINNSIGRKILQSLNWRWPAWSMAPCLSDSDCAGIHLSCIDGECGCSPKHVLISIDRACYPKAHIFAECVASQQCMAMNRNTYCNSNNRCMCSPGYNYDGRDCILRYDTNLKAQEVYKAAVVAAACFIVAVVGIFVACIVRRSFCRREGNVQHTSSSNSDVFSISDEIAALRAVDKPPSYEEVLQIERTFYGIPPPEYCSLRGRDCLQQFAATLGAQNNEQSQFCLPQYEAEPCSTLPSLAECPAPLTVTTADINNCRSNQNISPVDSPVVAATTATVAINCGAVNTSSSLQRRDSLINLSPSHLCRTVSIHSSHVCGIPFSSASAPSSPHLVSHSPRMPPSSLRDRLLRRISSFRFSCSRPEVPADPGTLSRAENNSPNQANCVPSDITTTENSQSTSNVSDSLTAYDNPAFINDQK